MLGMLSAMVAIPIGTADADSVEIGDYLFDLDQTDRTAYLHHYNGSDSNVTIPSKVTYDNVEYTVTDVGYLSFDGNEKLQSVTVPSTVKRIVEQAFDDCTALSTVKLSNGLEEIGVAAFKNCTKLESLTIPGSVKVIESSAFKGSGLTSFIMPDSVTDLGDYVFSGCKSLASATLSKNIKEIGYDLFDSCESLRTVQIPNGVTAIRSGAFSCCHELEAVNIPNGVKTIESYAFEECYKLKSIQIPDSVTTIGEYAFDECRSMETLTIGSSVTKIGFCAFDACESLKSVTIPGSVRIIDYTFNQCKSLEQLTLSEGVESIEGFNGCESLVSVTLPNSLKKLADAFGWCDKLTSVSIGSGLEDLGDYRLFQNCPLLERLTVSADNPNFKSVDNVLYSKDGKTLVLYPMGKTDREYRVLDGTVSICKKAFYENEHIETIIMPEGLKEIGEYAFLTCNNIRCMSFPASLTTVEYASTNMTFYLENEKVDQKADVLKGRTWNGNGDMKLYCFETSVFKITFMSEGTVVDVIDTGRNGFLSKEMPTPTYPGYVFEGWYDSIPGGHLITQDWVFHKDTYLFADWEKADAPVTGVSIDTPYVTLTLGNYTVLSAEIQPADATDHSVTWESSNPSVATVDQYGYVNSVSVGKAEITVTTHDGGYTAKATINVISEPQPTPGEGGGDSLWLILVVILILAAVVGIYYWKTHR